MENHLSLEPLMIARLRERVPAALDVLAAADMAAVEEKKMRFPALHVYYMGDKLDDRAGDGQFAEVEQTWGVVVAVRHLSGALAQRNAAGDLISAVLSALQGWLPGEDYSRMTRINAPAPLYRTGGYVFVPLYFTCRVLTMGAVD